MHEQFSHQISELLQRLPRVGGRLKKTVHIKGALAGWAADDIGFRVSNRAIRMQAPTQGNGRVWYLDDEHHRPADLNLELLRSGQTAKILPAWAQATQRALLSTLLHSDAHGWSSVIFMTDEVGATVGEHVDNEDVYTVQLYGSKRWTVDPPDLDWLRARVLGGELARLNPSESWVRNRPASVAFQRPTEYLVDPGDLLAMPAFCLHEVIALGPMETAAFNISICQEQDWR